jgi:hypothetical protein
MFCAVKRIRPKIMTVSVILVGLIPIMFSHGAGSDVMKRIAAPMYRRRRHFYNSGTYHLSGYLYDLAGKNLQKLRNHINAT